MAADPPNLYDEVMALIEAERWTELPAKVESALAEEGKVAAWAVYRGATRLAERATDAAEKERWTERAFMATEHAGNAKIRGRALVYFIPFLDERGEAGRGRRLAEEVLPTLPPDHVTVCYLAQPLAEFAIYEGRFDDALRYLEAAQGAATTPALRARVVGARGQIALSRGRVEIAAAAFSREKELLEAAPPEERRDALIASFLHRTNLRLATGQTKQLYRLVEEALKDPALAAFQPGFPSKMKLRLAFARMAEERLGQASTPSSEVILHEVLNDPHVSDADKTAALLRLTHLATNAGAWSKAAAFLDQLPATLMSFDEAYRTALRSRWRHREGSMKETVSLRDAWRRLATRWNDKLRETEGSGFLHYKRVRLLLSERVEVALRENAGAKGIEAALMVLVEARRHGKLHESLGAPDVTLAAIRETLVSPRGGLAFFLPAADRSHLFLLDHQGATPWFLPPRDELEQVRTRANELLRDVPRQGSRPGNPELTGRLRALREVLFPAPAEARLRGWSSLTVIGGDLIRAVPYAALVLSDGSELGRHVAIGALPSVSIGLALKERHGARGPLPHHALLIAAPKLSEEIQGRFPSAEPFSLDNDRGRRLLASYQRHTVLSGREATWRELSTRAEGVSVLQLIAHGVRDPDRAGQLTVLLAGDGAEAIDARILEQLSAPPLVIVSACGSGQGPMRLGDPGATDLSGPLLSAGALAVILSPGDLSLLATLALSEELHKYLARGDSPAEALRKARNALVADGTWAHPSYSAGYLVVGLAHEPLFEKRSSGALAWVAIMAALAAVVGGAVRVAGRRRRRGGPPTDVASG